MNFVTVQQTSQGLAKYLLEQFGEEKCKNQGITIGYDGRYFSQGFAHLSAAVFRHFNIRVLLYDKIVCTPMVPYGILRNKTLAGVMVTASHNPKDDNGYKLYWDNGA